MMSLFKLCALILGMVLLSGCGAPKPQPPVQVVEKELPSWYLSPPSNTADQLYGIGEGRDLEEATKKALDNLVSRLGISIASSYRSETRLRRTQRDDYEQSIINNIESEVSKIHISNYRVLENHQHRYNHFIVLVGSDRKVFSDLLKKQLKETFERLERKRSVIEAGDVMSRYNFFQHAVEAGKESRSKLLILTSLEEGFNDIPYLDQIKSYEEDFERVVGMLTFVVKAAKADEKFASAIRVALTDAHFRVVGSSHSNGNTLLVTLNSSSEYARAYGFEIARVQLDVNVKGVQGKSLGGNNIRLTGQSSQGRELALVNSVKKLEKLIQSEGIMKVLGLELPVTD